MNLKETTVEDWVQKVRQLLESLGHEYSFDDWGELYYVLEEGDLDNIKNLLAEAEMLFD